MSAYVADMLQV